MFPYATPIGAGEQGNDIRNTPGLSPEVKARDAVSLPRALAQARAGGSPDDIPIVIWRHNGQGPSTMDEFTVTMRLADFERLWRERREQDRF